MKYNMEKNKDYFIIDNFIAKEEQDRLEKFFLSTDIPWFLAGDALRTVPEEVHLRELKLLPTIFEFSQFVHILISFNIDTKVSTTNSNFVNSIYDILKNTTQFFRSSIEVIRSKINLQTRVNLINSDAYNTPHVDIDIKGFNYWTLVYYINDSDGPLRIFDNDNKIIETIEPEKGRAIILKGHIKHCGMHPTKNNFRCVLNINFTIDIPEELDKKE